MNDMFLDTVGLIAVWDGADQQHAAADAAYQELLKQGFGGAVLKGMGNRSRLAMASWSPMEVCMAYQDRIIIDPNILVGKPVVRGTRLSVDFLLGLMTQGWSESEILRNYPGLSREDLLACLEYANDLVRSERIYQFHVE